MKLIIAFCVCWGMSAQALPPVGAALRFDVASVRRSTGAELPKLLFEHGRLTCSNVTFMAILTRALGVQSYRVSGPAWLDTDHWEIVATAPPTTTNDEAMLMLQTLLAERFGLKFHRENRETSIFALVKTRAESLLTPADHGVGLSLAAGSSGTASIKGKVPLSELVKYLTWRLGKPVIDDTGLVGRYNIELEWVPLESEAGYRRPASGSSNTEAATELTPVGPSLFAALQETLGLKLESRKASLQYMVLDAVNRSPTEN